MDKQMKRAGQTKVMVEEAMSETMGNIVAELAQQEHLAKQRRRVQRDVPRRRVRIASVAEPPGHTDEDEIWEGRPEADIVIDPTLVIAVLWILENGVVDPTQTNDGDTAEDALQDWYDKRWSPDRPADSRVDRLGQAR